MRKNPNINGSAGVSLLCASESLCALPGMNGPSVEALEEAPLGSPTCMFPLSVPVLLRPWRALGCPLPTCPSNAGPLFWTRPTALDSQNLNLFGFQPLPFPRSPEEKLPWTFRQGCSSPRCKEWEVTPALRSILDTMIQCGKGKGESLSFTPRPFKIEEEKVPKMTTWSIIPTFPLPHPALCPLQIGWGSRNKAHYITSSFAQANNVLFIHQTRRVFVCVGCVLDFRKTLLNKIRYDPCGA